MYTFYSRLFMTQVLCIYIGLNLFERQMNQMTSRKVRNVSTWGEYGEFITDIEQCGIHYDEKQKLNKSLADISNFFIILIIDLRI
uniref:Uncharacterized protein n=1 Tax=Glossina brevipalpis TaxID=37001 RepID=A0A1A9W565_9MUSC